MIVMKKALTAAHHSRATDKESFFLEDEPGFPAWILEEETGLDPEEKAEFELLLQEMKQLNFTRSAQVSNYIVQNQLGKKYQNISGIVEMARKGETWSFRGGFPPKIYRLLCEQLGLENNRSAATAIAFRPFKTLTP